MSTRRPLLAVAVVACACAANRYEGGAESPIRLDTPPAVGWEPGGPYPLNLTVYNASGGRLSLVKPEPDAAQVKVFRDSGELVCQTNRPTEKVYEGWAAIPVSSSSGLTFTVSMVPFCGGKLTPGVYRYEAIYFANRCNSGSEFVWTGTLGPQGGRIAIGKGLSTDQAALAAALEATPNALGFAEPTTPGEQGGASGAVAAPAAAAIPVSPEAVRACVDRELAARSLNAYGDPEGTRYEGDKPPVEEGGRILYVAGRNGEIRAACKIPGF